MPRLTGTSSAPVLPPDQLTVGLPYSAEGMLQTIQLTHHRVSRYYPEDPIYPDAVQIGTGTNSLNMRYFRILPEDALKMARLLHNYATQMLVNEQAHTESQRRTN